MRAEKEAIAHEMRENLKGSDFFILADYQGLSVSQTEVLRKKLADTDARLMVLRNRQFAHVVRELEMDVLGERVPGPTAMVYGKGDVVETSKVLKSFIKENDKPVIKLGALDGSLITADQVQELADLPSREQLYGMVVGTLAAPMTQLVGVMNQKLCSLLYVLTAAKEKKEASA